MSWYWDREERWIPRTFDVRLENVQSSIEVDHDPLVHLYFGAGRLTAVESVMAICRSEGWEGTATARPGFGPGVSVAESRVVSLLDRMESMGVWPVKVSFFLDPDTREAILNALGPRMIVDGHNRDVKPAVLPVLFTFVDVAPLMVQVAIMICAKAAPATQVVDRGAEMVIAIPEAATAEVLGGFARAGIVPIGSRSSLHTCSPSSATRS